MILPPAEFPLPGHSIDQDKRSGRAAGAPVYTTGSRNVVVEIGVDRVASHPGVAARPAPNVLVPIGAANVSRQPASFGSANGHAEHRVSAATIWSDTTRTAWNDTVNGG